MVHDSCHDSSEASQVLFQVVVDHLTLPGQVMEVQVTSPGQVMVDQVTSPGQVTEVRVTSRPTELQFAELVVWSGWSGCCAGVVEAAGAGGRHGPRDDLG